MVGNSHLLIIKETMPAKDTLHNPVKNALIKLIYQTFLSITHPEYKVYLAISKKIYEKFFTQVAIELVLQKYQVLLLVVDVNKEEIVQWKS